MARFLAGVLTGIVAVVLVGLLALLSLGSPSAPAPSASVPGASPAPSAGPPAAGETVLSQVRFSSAQVLSRDADLRDVEATGEQVRAGESGIRVGRLSVDATLPYAAAARQVSEGVTLAPAPDGRARLTKVASVLGRDVTISAVGTVRAEDGMLAIEPESIDLGGPGVLDSAASALARSLATIRQPVQGLPPGTRLTEVRARDDGFRAHLEGSDVTLDTTS